MNKVYVEKVHVCFCLDQNWEVQRQKREYEYSLVTKVETVVDGFVNIESVISLFLYFFIKKQKQDYVDSCKTHDIIIIIDQIGKPTSPSALGYRHLTRLTNGKIKH